MGAANGLERTLQLVHFLLVPYEPNEGSRPPKFIHVRCS